MDIKWGGRVERAFYGIFGGEKTTELLKGLRDLGARCCPLLDITPLFGSLFVKLLVITLKVLFRLIGAPC